MNNRFPNTRQNRPPSFHQHQNQQFNNHNQQQKQLNPRAPQFRPYPPPQALPRFNAGAWNTPPPRFHQSWNSPPPQMMLNQNQQQRQPTPLVPPPDNFEYRQNSMRGLTLAPPRFHAQNMPAPPFISTRFAPHFIGDLPPTNMLQPLPQLNSFPMNNNQFRPNNFPPRPQSPSHPSFLPPQQHPGVERDHERVVDEKEMYKEKMKNSVSSWLRGKQFEDTEENSHLLKVNSKRPYLFSFSYVQGVLYTRWRLPQSRIASLLRGGHRLGYGLN